MAQRLTPTPTPPLPGSKSNPVPKALQPHGDAMSTGPMVVNGALLPTRTLPASGRTIDVPSQPTHGPQLFPTAPTATMRIPAQRPLQTSPQMIPAKNDPFPDNAAV